MKIDSEHLCGMRRGNAAALLPAPSQAQQQGTDAGEPGDGEVPTTRDIKIISSAGARALAGRLLAAWAEQNKQAVAMAILDWGGNLIESHAHGRRCGECQSTRRSLKAKSALRWRRATSETNKIVRSGENLAPTFMARLPSTRRAAHRGQWPGHRRDGRVRRRR